VIGFSAAKTVAARVERAIRAAVKKRIVVVLDYFDEREREESVGWVYICWGKERLYYIVAVVTKAKKDEGWSNQMQQ
jgi:hypothetical protein